MNEIFGLNQEAWARWCEYRKTRKKPYKTEFGVDRAQKKLASFGDYQMEAVERCMEKEWVDLYPVPANEIAKLKKNRDLQAKETRQLRELLDRARKLGFRDPLPQEDSVTYRMLLERFEHQRWQQSRSAPRSIGELLGAKS